MIKMCRPFAIRLKWQKGMNWTAMMIDNVVYGRKLEDDCLSYTSTVEDPAAKISVLGILFRRRTYVVQ